MRFIILTSLIVVFALFNQPSLAVKTSMTGDYAMDTISVVKKLQAAVETACGLLRVDQVISSRGD